LALGAISGLGELLTIGIILPFVSIITKNGDIDLPIPLNLDSLDLLILLLATIIVTCFCRIYLNKKTTFLSQEIGFKLSTKIFRNILSKNFIAFKKIQKEEYVALINVKVNIYINRVVLPVLMILTNAIMILILIVGMLYYNFYLVSCLILITTLLYTIYNKLQKKRLHKLSQINARNSIKINKVINDLIGAFKEITVTNNKNRYVQDFAELEGPFRTSQAKIQFISTLPKYVFESIFVIFLLAMSYFFRDFITIEEIAALTFGLQKILPMGQLINGSLINIRSSSHIIGEIDREYFSELAKRKETNYPVLPIVLNKLAIGFDDILASGLNAKIQDLDKILIVGKSGSGKTTLVDTIIGLIPPKGGDVMYGAYETSSFSQFSIVPQDFYIFNHSIKNNIIGDHEFDLKKFEKVVRQAELQELLENFGVHHNVGDNGSKLSGGQRQRIALARALYSDRPILVLDEITSALDDSTSMRILSTLTKVDRTILLISHDVRAKKYFKKIINTNEL
jgi:ABC-type multidrug transport system fused ATPase/permease subunit